MIKVENIHGKLLLIGAEDDGLWDTARYIRRMDKRLAGRQHFCEYKALVYEHGTHFVFPETLLKSMIPCSKFVLRFFFADAKKYPEECRRTRISIEKEITEAFQEWNKTHIFGEGDSESL